MTTRWGLLTIIIEDHLINFANCLQELTKEESISTKEEPKSTETKPKDDDQQTVTVNQIIFSRRWSFSNCFVFILSRYLVWN